MAVWKWSLEFTGYLQVSCVFPVSVAGVELAKFDNECVSYLLDLDRPGENKITKSTRWTWWTSDVQEHVSNLRLLSGIIFITYIFEGSTASRRLSVLRGFVECIAVRSPSNMVKFGPMGMAVSFEWKTL